MAVLAAREDCVPFVCCLHLADLRLFFWREQCMARQRSPVTPQPNPGADELPRAHCGRARSGVALRFVMPLALAACSLAMLLGLLESIGPSLFLDGLGIPAPYQLKDAIAFSVLVLILIFRPTGILGERLAQAKA